MPRKSLAQWPVAMVKAVGLSKPILKVDVDGAEDEKAVDVRMKMATLVRYSRLLNLL